MASSLYLLIPRSPTNPRRDPYRIRLRLVYDHSLSRYGMGVLLWPDQIPFDGATFRRLRDGAGCMLVASDPVAACRAMGIPENEPGVYDAAT